MINWTKIRTKADLNPDNLHQIRLELLKDAQKRCIRVYALMIAVLLLGVDEYRINNLKVQFLPPAGDGVSWVIMYDGRPLNMPDEVRRVFWKYIQNAPQFRGCIEQCESVLLPLFYSECRRTHGKPLTCCHFIIQDCFKGIGCPCMILLKDVAMKPA